MTRLVLKRPHTHAGKAFQAGDRLDTDAATADWLIAHGVALSDAAPPKADPEPTDNRTDLPRSQRKEPKP